MKKLALISVSDRTNLLELSQSLVKAGYEILATTGSKAYLDENNIPTLSIEDYTQQKEILDGRVKTLHPKIHAGILAKRDQASHLAQLEEENISAIDIVVVNLYPFLEQKEKLKDLDEESRQKKLIEFIDVGGPTMIRAAAKNFNFVLPLLDPNDYPEVIKYLDEKKDFPKEFRRNLAGKVFSFVSSYDLAIAEFLSSSEDSYSQYQGVVLQKSQNLRYGENPAQKAAFYIDRNLKTSTITQLQGKELSYNNLLDLDAISKIARGFFNKTAAVIVKHGNPCGAAIGENLLDVFNNAKKCDPRSHFGGVIALTKEVDETVALAIGEDFAEIVCAPSFTKAALDVLAKKKNLRLIETDFNFKTNFEIRNACGGYLLQSPDNQIQRIEDMQVVTKRKLQANEIEDLNFAWQICANVKSNAITLVKDKLLLGVGAGQMSRIDSVELALSKAELHTHNIKDAVCASDAFFPFSDSIETLAKKGITAIVAPSGATRDKEVIEEADKYNLSLVFANERHFRH